MVLSIGLAAVLGATAAGVTFGAVGTSEGPPPLTFETQGAAHAMASAFARPAANAMPTDVSNRIAAIASAPETSSDPPGRVVVSEGQQLLNNLGPSSRAIYAFPTTTGGVCYVITGVAQGCKHSFPVGEPATIDGDTLYPPSQNGPVSEMGGLTEDDVTNVQVVVNGVAHETSFGDDAWYYSFPDSETPPSAVTAVRVTLKGGAAVTVPTDFVDH